MDKSVNIPLSDPLKDAYLRSTLIKDLTFQQKTFTQSENSTAVPIKKLKNFDHIYFELSKVIKPNLPAKDLISSLVETVLRINFGKSFTLVKGFDKIIEKISAAVMADPYLRKESLKIVSIILDENKKLDSKKVLNG